MPTTSKLFIKGMVCERCMMVVKKLLEDLDYYVLKVELGEITVIFTGEEPDRAQVEERLKPLGLSLLEDKKVKIVQDVKKLVEEVYSGDYDFPESFRFSDILRKHYSQDYGTLSSLFSLLEHKSLERYIIDYRIEKVKEYLVYSDYTLSDIAFKLNFNSVPHLSAQFRQHTGLTPSYFKDVKRNKSVMGFSAS
jgi:AraC family transcriptional regulator